MSKRIKLFLYCSLVITLSTYAEESPDASGTTSITIDDTQVNETGSLEAVLAQALETGEYTKLRIFLKTANETDADTIEAAIIDAARIKKDEEAFSVASSLVSIVLEENLDNTNAQNLMVEITQAESAKARRDAIKKEIEAEKAREELKRLEAERLTAERIAREKAIEEKRRTDAERLEAERLEAERIELERRKSPATVDAVERNPNAFAFRDYAVMADLSPATLYVGTSSITGADTDFAYGFRVGLDGQVDYTIVRFAGQAAFDYTPLTLGDTETRNSTTFRASATWARLPLPLYLSVGYKNVAFGAPSAGKKPSVAFDGIRSAMLGVSLERYPLYAGLDLSVRASWLPLNVIDDLIYFAADVDMLARYRVMKLRERYTLFACLGSTTTILVADGGNEIGQTVYLSAGVSLDE